MTKYNLSYTFLNVERTEVIESLYELVQRLFEIEEDRHILNNSVTVNTVEVVNS